MRELSQLLRPSTLDELGLAATVESFVHEWSKQFGIPADFHTAGLAKTRLRAETEANIYRTAQEGLTNVARHAGVPVLRLGAQMLELDEIQQIEVVGAARELEEVRRHAVVELEAEHAP